MLATKGVGHVYESHSPVARGRAGAGRIHTERGDAIGHLRVRAGDVTCARGHLHHLHIEWLGTGGALARSGRSLCAGDFSSRRAWQSERPARYVFQRYCNSSLLAISPVLRSQLEHGSKSDSRAARPRSQPGCGPRLGQPERRGRIWLRAVELPDDGSHAIAGCEWFQGVCHRVSARTATATSGPSRSKMRSR